MIAKEITQTCRSCPTQYEIKLEDGRIVYFRYRWGNLTMNISNEATDDIMKAVNGEEIYFFDANDPYDGHMEEDEVRKHISKAGIGLTI